MSLILTLLQVSVHLPQQTHAWPEHCRPIVVRKRPLMVLTCSSVLAITSSPLPPLAATIRYVSDTGVANTNTNNKLNLKDDTKIKRLWVLFTTKSDYYDTVSYGSLPKPTAPSLWRDIALIFD